MAFQTSETKHGARGRGFLPLYALCTLACGSGSNAPAGTGPGAVSDSAVTQVTFTEVYAAVLQPTCSPCHRPGGEGSFQDFSSQSSAYSALVGVKASGPSCGSTGDTRVVPGHASESLIFEKVSEASPPCGSQMPLGGPPVSNAQVTSIETWINAGALDD
jgi:hypothetical protein